MFFKRLSRSRSNSQSYVDTDARYDSKTNSQYDDPKYDRYDDADPQQQRPPPSRSASDRTPAVDNANMYPRQGAPQEVSYNSPPMSAGGPHSRGMSNGGYGRQASFDAAPPPQQQSQKSEPAPDLLLAAFNQALRPYNDKVENLESEIADLRAYIEQLEGQRTDIHAWIDKRGLRPDVPPSIARTMDAASHTTSPTHAAATLNAQLDRKITIVNFDLHRLQDDLNDSLPTPSFSACMLKFLPDISRLGALPSGPRYAFDLLLKLGGNLNSHGGLENGDEEDLAERRQFYARLDEAMVDVVRGRFREEGESWGVQREVKRIEKTGAYLRNWGVEPYFPGTLEVMRDGAGMGQAGAGAPQSPGAYA